jgi:two-component system, cell cycle sensor histidine kinase and response regulator CckA
VTVTDTGTGIDDVARPHLFEPFYTTKGLGRGSGLGLSTAQGIARQSGGDVVLVDTAPGRGSTFTLFLPAVDDPVSLAAAPKAEPAERGSGTILIAEDDPGVRRLAQRILSDAGYAVLTAADGGDALAVLDAHPEAIDLLFTDVIMPTMGGRELARRIAEVRPKMRILFTSGYPGDALTGDATFPPGTSFIGKPYAAEVLAARVRELLEDRG